MHQDLLKLHALQQLDGSIREREEVQRTLPQASEQQRAEHDTQLTAHRALLAQVEQLEGESRQLYGHIETERDKVRKWEARLGDIRNQREYQALQRETEGQRRANRDSETRLQELNQQVEQLRGDASAQAETLEARGKEIAEQTAEVNQKVKAIEAELSAMRASRDTLAADVPGMLLKRYEAIRTRRAGIGLSVIAQGSCISCHMRLPPQLYNVLQRGDSVEQCPSCSRIMIWSQVLPGAADEAAEEAKEAKPAPKKTRTRRKAASSAL